MWKLVLIFATPHGMSSADINVGDTGRNGGHYFSTYELCESAGDLAAKDFKEKSGDWPTLEWVCVGTP